jgi:hypothetical protein
MLTETATAAFLLNSAYFSQKSPGQSVETFHLHCTYINRFLSLTHKYPARAGNVERKDLLVLRGFGRRGGVDASRRNPLLEGRCRKATAFFVCQGLRGGLTQQRHHQGGLPHNGPPTWVCDNGRICGGLVVGVESVLRHLQGLSSCFIQACLSPRFPWFNCARGSSRKSRELA